MKSHSDGLSGFHPATPPNRKQSEHGQIRETIIAKLNQRFDAYVDLVDQSDDKGLAATLDIPKHKSLAEHLWCIVGARESYANALAAGEWVGFNCSLTAFNQRDVRAALVTSAQAVLTTLQSIEDWTDAREQLLATLAEHEVMHEGQIIRHLYACERQPPASLTWA